MESKSLLLLVHLLLLNLINEGLKLLEDLQRNDKIKYSAAPHASVDCRDLNQLQLNAFLFLSLQVIRN